MKFIVAVDCEGVACAVGSPGASLNESRDLEFAKLQASRGLKAGERIDPYTVRWHLDCLADYF